MRLEIVGYVPGDSGIMLCVDCADANEFDLESDAVTPVFESDDTDCPSSCDACHVFIAESLTPEGVRYVISAAWREIHEGKRGVVVGEWVDHIRYYGGMTPFQRGVIAKHDSLTNA